VDPATRLAAIKKEEIAIQQEQVGICIEFREFLHFWSIWNISRKQIFGIINTNFYTRKCIF
jgi:hypothetical protein